LDFHTAPNKKPEMFEKFLPLAMVFGVEKEWAKQFESAYKGRPAWYSGVEGEAFNSVVLTNILGSFSTATSSSLSSNPSSAISGEGGFSGCGGGSW
jgi:hypothetical protein